jgi:hypothetical protein
MSKYRTKKFENELINFLEQNKVDTAIVFNSHMGWTIEILNKYKIPAVLREENFELRIMERFYKNKKNPIIRIFAVIQFYKMKKYEPHICSKFDSAIMMSEADAEALHKLEPGAKTEVIPVGI